MVREQTHHDEGDSADRGITRRSVLRGAAAVTSVATFGSLAGCTGGGGGGADQEVYVVAFHWGFNMIRPDGTAVEEVTASSGDTIAIHGVNLEPIAGGEDIDIPDAVMSTASESYQDWEHESLERIAPLVGMPEADLEEELEAAEEQYKDHGMAMLGPDGDSMFTVTLSGDQTAPETQTVTLDATGSYGFTCTTFCGVGHAYMQLEDAITVS